MKKTIKTLAVAFAMSIMLTSCYSYTSVVGKGAQGTTQVKKWNNYLIGGLVPVGVSDSKQMAGDSKDYTVETKISFVNSLVRIVTFGIYSPSVTTVTK
jgi:hypothetical protein